MRKFLLVAAFFLTAAFSLQAQGVQASLIDAVSLYGRGQYKKAGEILHTLSLARPEDDAVWYYLALTQLQAKDLDSAAKSSARAVLLDSTNYWYRRLEARIKVIKDNPEEGIALYESIVKDFPKSGNALYELLDLYLKNEKFEDALKALEQVEVQQGPSEEVVRTKYEVYCAMGKQDEGAALLEEFSREYSLPTILTTLGDYYVADFRDSLGLARYEEALSLDSSFVPAILGKSEALRHMRRYGEYFDLLEPIFSSKDVPATTKSMYIGSLPRAIDPKILQLHRSGFDSLAVKAAEAHPTDSTLLSAVGTYYYSTGRTEDAGKWFRTSAKLYPESITQTATYVQYLEITGDWKDLREESLAAFGRFGEPAFLDYASLASYRLEDYDGIIDIGRIILERYPSDKTLCLAAWSQTGDAYHSKGDARNAYKAYEKALRIDSGYAPVLNNYAYYLSLEGKKLSKAYKMSKKTVEKEPDNPTYLDTFAWILHLMGKDLEAKPFFKHAMLYGGKDNAVILRHYATVLDALGETENAKLYRGMADKLGPGEE